MIYVSMFIPHARMAIRGSPAGIAEIRRKRWSGGRYACFRKRVDGSHSNCLLTCAALGAQESRTQMPKVWDDAAIASVDLPLAVAAASPVQISSKYYYGIPVGPFIKAIRSTVLIGNQPDTWTG